MTRLTLYVTLAFTRTVHMSTSFSVHEMSIIDLYLLKNRFIVDRILFNFPNSIYAI